MTPAITRESKSEFGPAPNYFFLIEALIVAISGLGAFLLRFEFEIPGFYIRQLELAVPLWLAVKLTVFHLAGLDRSSRKFFSTHDVLRLARANVLGSLGAASLLYGIVGRSFPHSIPVLDLMLCFLITTGLFVACRVQATRAHSHADGRRVLIYGAGYAGVHLLAETRANPALRYKVCGFIDDDPKLFHTYLHGLKILGNGSDLTAVCARRNIEEVLIAAPSANSEQIVRILQHCQQAGVRYRTVATLGEIIEGKALASQIREVDLQDLLYRTPVHLDHQSIRQTVEGKVVMVTGAAGSIGSELCRQLAHFRPAAIVAFEIAETPLFHLDREMRAQFPDVNFHPEIGSIQNSRRLASAIAAHRPTVIYHAAAYKHVPLMEANILDAIENNVFGTYHLVTAAEEYGVENLVLISSDKAVRPSSVMGATKRLCELLVLSLPGTRTRRSAVRFGNVLGSNGSVIPLFKQQIATGGPLTVTHPDMRRYFMTIQEASQLVLQASAMGSSGQIFVLDMGEQIKIVDLAKRLIQLSGLVPDVDIEIEFTGTRPGEKLYEELSMGDEIHFATSHPKIKVFVGNGVTAESILSYTKQLMRICASGDEEAGRLLIQELVPEYRPLQRIPPAPSQRLLPGALVVNGSRISAQQATAGRA